MLDKNIANEESQRISVKVTALSCLTCLFLSKLFSHQEVSEVSLRLIERWFTTVADSEDFLELDFKLVAAILNSSELLIDSELQVFNAANAWLNHKRIQRSKHAKYLLQRVRLSLLTVPALKSILNKNLWVTENDDCSEVIKKVIEYKNKFPYKNTNTLKTSRHCSQENFNIIFAGSKNESTGAVVRYAFSIDGTEFSSAKSLSIINYGRSYLKTVCIKGEIYVFGGKDDRYNPVMHIEKYSPATNTWDVIGEMNDNRINFCAGSFIDSIYV